MLDEFAVTAASPLTAPVTLDPINSTAPELGLNGPASSGLGPMAVPWFDASSALAANGPVRDWPLGEWPQKAQPAQVPSPQPVALSSRPDPLLGSHSLRPQAADRLLNPAVSSRLQSVWEDAIAALTQFRQRTDWQADMRLAFGDGWRADQAQDLLDGLIAGQIAPSLDVVPVVDLRAKGAFAAECDRIYLAQELLSSAHPTAAKAVLLEELGHFLDARLNPVDSPGDEGAIFAATVQQQSLTAAALTQLKAEDDTASLVWNGQPVRVEQASLEPGVFTVDASGQVSVQFVFDSGAYTGEVGLFSLSGMAGLQPGSAAFIQEAARRVLSNSTQGSLVITDRAEGAALSGELGEANRNAGPTARLRNVAMQAGDQISVLLVPNGTVATVLQNPAAEGALRPLFSIASANPGQRVQMGQLSANSTGGTYGFEDQRLDQSSDADYNDVIFTLSGATGQAQAVTSLVAPRNPWPTTALGQRLFALSPLDPPGLPGESPLPFPVKGGGGNVLASISSTIAKFGASTSEAQIAATGAARVTVGTRTVYIGTDQVSAINQNPIVASFDSANPANNWVRTDYEITGADGRGLGLAWDGANLYGVFSVDGTQGTSTQDFRRAAANAQQTWLRSYGQGGGPKVAVLGRIDPTTGQLLDAAYLSAVLGNGSSNSLSVTGLTVNGSGNLVVSAQSYFAPRRPDGQAMTQVTLGNSPFAYTVEITPDLKKVVSTAAAGWV